MQLIKKLLTFLLIAVLLGSAFACEDTPTEKPDGSDKNPPLPPAAEEEDKDEEKPTDTKPTLVPLTLKNETASGLIPVRGRYYDAAALYSRLYSLRDALDKKTVDTTHVKGYLGSLLRESEDVGLYYDYASLLPLREGEHAYGNRIAAGAIANGSKKPTMVASDEANLLAALAVSVPGDVIVIRDEIEIDMADLYTAGTVKDYVEKDSPDRLRIPEGVTLAGERGQNGKTGGVLTISCETDLLMTLSEGASLDGLCIRGPNDQSGLSFGILIAGDGASIRNCEITGFADTAVKVAADNVSITHSFIHRIQGDPGIAIDLANGSLNVEGCLFSNVNTCVSIQGTASSLRFCDNVDAGNVKNPIVVLSGSGYDADYPTQTVAASSIVVENNTFLSPSPLFSLGGLPSGEFSVQHNLFAYHPYFHNSGECDLLGVDDSVYESRYICQNNVYDLQNPYIMYKTAGVTKDGIASGSRPVSPLLPTESLCPQLHSQAAVPLAASAFYSLNGSPFAPLSASLKKGDTASLKTALNEAVKRLVDLDPNRLHKQTAGGGLTENRYTEGDYVAKSILDLQFAFITARSGDVIFIPSGSIIDFSNPDGTIATLEIPEGVTLASDRGRILEDGSVATGAILTTPLFSASPLMEISLDHVTLSGLCIVGVDPYTHYSHYNRAYEGGLGGSSRKTYYNLVPYTTGIVVRGNHFTMENCEVAGFSLGLRFICNNPEVRPAATVKDCYFHHLQRRNYGYGIYVAYTDLTLHNNLFSHCQTPYFINDTAVCRLEESNNPDLGGVPVWHSTLLNFNDIPRS